MTSTSVGLLPPSGISRIDIVTNGTYWILDSSRTVTWATSDFGLDFWANPSAGAAMIESALAKFEEVANIHFQYLGHYTDPNFAPANMVFSATSFPGLFGQSPSVLAWAYFPNEPLTDAWTAPFFGSAYPNAAGDVWVNLASEAIFYPTYPGSDGFFLFLHEIGHALGLKHPHDDGGTGRPTATSVGLSPGDIQLLTVMSYNEGSPVSSWFAGNPDSLMPYDILALQWIYGANNATGAGNNSYSLLDDGALETFWDAGGVDQVSAAAASAGWIINLEAGSNIVGHTIGAAAPKNSLVTLKFFFDVENVVGSAFADTIAGSELANSLIGLGGADTLEGVGGNDTLDGGSGVDTAFYHGVRSTFSIASLGGSTWHVADNDTFANGNEGTDTLSTVEFVQFSDQIINLSTLIVDAAAPTAVSFSPSDEAANVAIASNISVTFSEVIQRGTGTIALKTAAGVMVETYNAATSANLSIAGLILTINPTADLAHNTGYTVEFAAGSIRDLAGNNYAGTTSYNFTTVAPPGPSLSIAATSADKPEGNTATTPFTFTVTRSVNTTGSTSVNWAMAGAASSPWADADDFLGGEFPSGTLNFSAGETTKTITVNVVADTVYEGGGVAENFVMMLSGASAGATIATATANGRIQNDDVAAPTLSIVPTSADKAEGNGGVTPFTFTVTRAVNTTGSTTVDWAVYTSTASTSADAADFGGTFPNGTLIFAANETTKTITVNVAADALYETNGIAENFTVTLFNPSGGATLNTAIASGRIQNDDVRISEILATFGNDTLNGTPANDRIEALAGDDLVFGGAGNDTLNGGFGDDTLNGGNDNDSIIGGDGNDQFDWDISSRDGIDTFVGGPGDDTYVVFGADVIVEGADEGNDWVWADANFSIGSLGNVENLILFGIDPVSATGNALANLILGNHSSNLLDGREGNDLLDGGGGNDTVMGGAGDDAIVGGDGNDRLEGGAGNDHFDRNSQGPGNDTFIGGQGDDNYVMFGIDQIVENSDEGIDTAWATADFSIEGIANVENVVLFGDQPVSLVGNALDNLMLGNAAANVLDGKAGDDSLQGLGGNDTLNGGTGLDVAFYDANRSAYSTNRMASGYTVSGPDGFDTLSSIERIAFMDKGIAFDLGVNQAASNTVRIIGAAFDGPSIQQHPDWVGLGLGFFDDGQTTLQVCQLVAQILGLNNVNLVTTVFTNVVGSAPDIATRDAFVSMLQGSGGSMTQAQFLEMAANHPMNELNINLVGLQQSGVEFV